MTNNRNKEKADIMWLWAALLAAGLWGFSYAMVENVLKGGVSATALMAFYTWLALPLFTLIAWQNGTLKEGVIFVKANPSIIASIVVLVLCYLFGNVLIYWAIKQKDATTVSLIEISYPIFVALFSYLIFKTSNLTWHSIVGGLLIFCGVVVISFKK